MTPTSVDPGVDILHGFLEELQLEKERFDVVLAFDVLEHFEAPGDALRKVAATLKPGGLLLIETGTRDCAFGRLFKTGWYYLQYLEHLQAFNERSLREALRRNGLLPTLVDRVRHSTGTFAGVASQAANALAFGALSLRGNVRAWRSVARAIAPGRNATPPPTTFLEKDHLFVVAEKPFCDNQSDT